MRRRRVTSSGLRIAVQFGALAVALTFVGSASAMPPSLRSVHAVNGHPRATFSAPRAGAATISIATKPDRSSSGGFVSENVVLDDKLSASEIKSGKWRSELRLKSGTYYVMLSADPKYHECFVYGRSGTYRPSCAAGSNLLRLSVPAR